MGQFEDIVSVVSPAICGLGIGFFGCLLSSAKEQRIRNDGKYTPKSRCYRVTGTIGSFVFSLFSLIPLVFGASVNVVNIVRAGTLLPANAFFSQVFGLRPLVRDDYVGTLVTINGVICFVLYAGPPAPEPDAAQFLEQLSRPVSITFSATIMASFVWAASWMNIHRRLGKKGSPLALTLAVSVVISSSIAAMDVATKGWSAALRSGGSTARPILLWVSLLVQACFFLVSKWGMIYGCGHCDMLVFVPVNIVLNVFFGAFTGLFVLGEAAQVPGWQAWMGLASAMMCVIGGIVMLVSGPAQADLATTPLGAGRTGPVDDESSGSDEAPSDAASTASAPARLNGAFWMLVSKSAALAYLNVDHRHAADSRELLLEEVAQGIEARHLRRSQSWMMCRTVTRADGSESDIMC